MKRKQARDTMAREQAERLNIQLRLRDRKINQLEEQLKAVDEAIFECIQKTSIAPLGKLTDDVMRRVTIYSNRIGVAATIKIINPPKRKRKTRR